MVTSVLVVEDDPEARRRLSAILEREFGDMQLRFTGDVSTARTDIDEFSGDCVILDLELEDEKLIQVREVAATLARKRVPMIIVTGHPLWAKKYRHAQMDIIAPLAVISKPTQWAGPDGVTSNEVFASTMVRQLRIAVRLRQMAREIDMLKEDVMRSAGRLSSFWGRLTDRFGDVATIIAIGLAAVIVDLVFRGVVWLLH